MVTNNNQSNTSQPLKLLGDYITRNCAMCGESFEAEYVKTVDGLVPQDICKACRRKKFLLMVEQLKKEKKESMVNNIGSKLVYEKITCKCIDCGKDFEGLWLKLLSKPKLCKECVIKLEEKEKVKENEQNQRRLEFKRNTWLNACGIPDRFKNDSFDNFKVVDGNRLAYETCVQYADDFKLGKDIEYKTLVMFSNKIWGNGKSHLSYAIAKRIIDRLYTMPIACPVYCITEYNLFSRIRATFGNNNTGESEDSILQKLTNIPLLIIDDVGKEEVSDLRFVQRIYFALIDGRYNNLKPLVMTANLNPDELAHYLGGSRETEATWQRLLQMCDEKVYEVRDKTHRLKS